MNFITNLYLGFLGALLGLIMSLLESKRQHSSKVNNMKSMGYQIFFSLVFYTIVVGIYKTITTF